MFCRPELQLWEDWVKKRQEGAWVRLHLSCLGSLYWVQKGQLGGESGSLDLSLSLTQSNWLYEWPNFYSPLCTYAFCPVISSSRLFCSAWPCDLLRPTWYWQSRQGRGLRSAVYVSHTDLVHCENTPRLARWRLRHGAEPSHPRNVRKPSEGQQTFQLTSCWQQAQEWAHPVWLRRELPYWPTDWWEKNAYCWKSLTSGGCLSCSISVAMDAGPSFVKRINLILSSCFGLLEILWGQIYLTWSLKHFWHSGTFLIVPGTW